MASELSKLIEDQLQKVDEENQLPSPTEKQRLLSSSLRIKTSPGKKNSKGSPGIVKLSKEQPSPPSIAGTSVPVPSGHSWVTDGQGFQWTKWRIGVAVFIVVAIVIALVVAFSHPSSKIHHTDVAGFSQRNEAATEPLVAGSPVGSDLGEAANEKQKTKSMQHPIVEEKVAAAADHSLLNSPEPDSLLSAPGAAGEVGAAEVGHHKHMHKQHPKNHAHPGQHPAHALAPHKLAPAPLLAASPTTGAALPPSNVPAMGPEALAAWFGTVAPSAGDPAAGPLAAAAPGGADAADSGWFGLTAGIHRAVPGVAGNPLDLQQPATVQDMVLAGANEAFDKLHGGGQQMEQQPEEGQGIAGVAGFTAEEDSEEWVGEDDIDKEDLEVAGGITGQDSLIDYNAG